MEIILEQTRSCKSRDCGCRLAAETPARQRKHGVSALKSGNLNEAGKRLDEAYKLAPSNSDLNFLLGYLYYQKKILGRAWDPLQRLNQSEPAQCSSAYLGGTGKPGAG